MIRLLCLAALLCGCRKEAPPSAPAPESEDVAPSSVVLPKELLEECTQLAVPVRGRRKKGLPPAEPVAMPPLATENVDPVSRRLEALRALDQIRARLESDPRSATLHFQMGRVHLHSLQNAEAAVGFLCRAMMLEPDKHMYRLGARAPFMEPGLEPQLELTLAPGERILPWRDALTTARAQRGLTWWQRVEMFEESVRAQRLVRNNRLLPREGVSGVRVDLAEAVNAWLTGVKADPQELRLTISFRARNHRLVSSLAHRDADGIPGQVFATPGPGGRWLLFSKGQGSVASLLETARQRLGKKLVGLSLLAGGSRAYVVGRFKGGKFSVRAMAMQPEVSALRAALSPPPPEGQQ